MRITVVTVTYGSRWHLLRETLTAAFQAGVNDVVVVDNASAEDISALACEAFPGRARALRLSTNAGSAGGYKCGIEAAVADQAEFILLLDDDNCIESEALTVLQDTFAALLAKSSLDGLCVVGFRPAQMPEILHGRPHDAIGASCGTFFGFHAKDVPIKVVRRLFGTRRHEHASQVLGQAMRLRTAPFGGMLFHRSVIGRFGYPDARFVLYVDDTEFSYRISAGGGDLWLEPRARIRDIQSSWQAVQQPTNSFDVWLANGSARHVYYTARNWAYFQTHCRKTTWGLHANKAIFLTILWSMALLRRRLTRFRLILNAICEGETGLLGANPQFPPGACD